MSQPSTFRIATYNIHKCEGFDRRTAPDRIIEVLREVDADVLCLQEVVNVTGETSLLDQSGEIARAFPEHLPYFGANRPFHTGTYGNLTLSRFPVASWQNVDITERREPRGVLQTDLSVAGKLIHVFNVHLGTGFMERRRQALRLLGARILGQPSLRAPRLVLGDFNEWVTGLTTRLLRDAFSTFSPKHALKFPKTFPGMLPFATLDHCYYEPPLELVSTALWRSRTALIASDHLPLLADFRLS